MAVKQKGYMPHANALAAYSLYTLHLHVALLLANDTAALWNPNMQPGE